MMHYLLFEIAFAVKQGVKLVLRRGANTRDYVKATYVAEATTLLSTRKLLSKRRFVQSLRRVDDKYVLAKHDRSKDWFSRLILKLS